jgi:hypothetical protein
MSRSVALAFALAVSLAWACRRSPEPTPTAPAAAPAAPGPGRATAKIWIANGGVIELNGRTVELPEVGAALDDLAKRNGQVIFGQDLPAGMPHPNVVKVLQMISDRSLDFRSAHDRSFSDLAPDHHYDKSFLGRD